MRFVTDVMLGRLSRWLRLLGFDTTSGLRDDLRLLQTAAAEGRTLLTRDRALIEQAERMGITCIYISSSQLQDQIVELFESLGSSSIDLDPAKSRCPMCNGELKAVPREQLPDQVPEKVLRYHSEFYVCAACGKIYWMGRHWENIEKKISDANAMIKEKHVGPARPSSTGHDDATRDL